MGLQTEYALTVVESMSSSLNFCISVSQGESIVISSYNYHETIYQIPVHETISTRTSSKLFKIVMENVALLSKLYSNKQ